MNESILKKVKRIEIATRKVMNDFMSGGYKSHFRGQGVQFSEHRVYASGDDIRHIDWKVSARSKEPLIKQYEEERELNVLIIADLSASLGFGSLQNTKKDLVTELGAVIAYAASNTGDKVGALIVTHEVRKIIELKKGKNHVRRIIRDLLAFPLESGGTKLQLALEEALHLMKSTGVIFILSDFRATGYDKALKRLAKKHDVVAIQIQDANEYAFQDLGPISLQDPETGKVIDIQPGKFSFKSQFIKEVNQFEQSTQTILNLSGVERITVNTNEDYVEQLLRFFQLRKKKK
jgi:uncharacterized protein (DUF58 family)